MKSSGRIKIREKCEKISGLEHQDTAAISHSLLPNKTEDPISELNLDREATTKWG